MTLPEPAGYELDALHAALDMRLAALEAALANPHQHDTLEQLMLDLAQVATRESEAAARRAAMLAQTDAYTQASDALARAHAAETSLSDARAAGSRLQTDLDRSQADLDSLRRELESAQETAREADAALRSRLDEAEQRAVAADAAHQADVAHVQDESAAALGREREVAQGLTAAMATLQQERDAAVRDGDARIHTLEMRVQELSRQSQESEGARLTSVARVDEAMARGELLAEERAAMERAWHDTQAQLAEATRERDAATRERDAANAARDAATGELDRARHAASAAQATGAAHAEENARHEEFRLKAERRIHDLQMEMLKRHVEVRATDVELTASLGDADASETPVAVTPAVVTAAKPEAAAPAPDVPKPSRKAAPRKTQAAPPAQAAHVPARGASRQAFREALAVRIDGDAGLLVDLSVVGAQLLSAIALRPNRSVTLLLPSTDRPVLCKGRIVWARFEPASGRNQSLRYRAGVKFAAADEEAVQGFMTRHAPDLE